MKRMFLCGFVLFFFGCDSTIEHSNSLTIKAKAKEVCSVNGLISIEIKDYNDSRCPKGCQCFWAGEARVNVNISDGNNSMDTCLVLPSQPTVTFMKYTIELKDVSPYPICDAPSIADYEFSFLVSL